MAQSINAIQAAQLVTTMHTLSSAVENLASIINSSSLHIPQSEKKMTNKYTPPYANWYPYPPPRMDYIEENFGTPHDEGSEPKVVAMDVGTQNTRSIFYGKPQH